MEQNLNSTKTLSERNLSLDVLKILSMVMVIILHTKTYGLQGVSLENSTGIYWLTQSLHIFSLVAVNCFVLISGYFTSTSKIRPIKLIKLWTLVTTFSLGIYLLLCAIPSNSFELSFGEILVSIFPVMANRYWFFTCYIVMMVLSPFINKFIDSLDKATYQKLLAVLLVLFVGINSLNFWGDSLGTGKGYSVLWFIVLYLVAAHIRRYGLPKLPYGILHVAISIFSTLTFTLLKLGGKYFEICEQASEILLRYNSATVFWASVCLFLFFLNHPIKPTKISQRLICDVSGASFGVYLLHEHPLLRDILWNNIVRLQGTTNSVGSYLVRMLISIVVIFVAGVISGWLVMSIINLLEKLIRKILKK